MKPLSGIIYICIKLFPLVILPAVMFSSCETTRSASLAQHISTLGGAVNGIVHSPLKTGYGINIAPGFQPKNSRTGFLALLSYSRFTLGDGGGSSNYFQIGPQVRHFFQKEHNTGFFAGGEITYLRTILKFDDNPIRSYSNGYTVGGIAGYRIKSGVLSFYFAPAYMHRGAFVTDGVSDNDPANGFFGRIGVDVHVVSLLAKKGK